MSEDASGWDMPSGNRVEELENRVAELEATVQGLTEELVEANDRIRQLEAALGGGVDVDVTGGDEEMAAEPSTFESTDHAEVERADPDHDIEAAEDNDRVEIMGLEHEVSVEEDTEAIDGGAAPEEVAQAAAEAAKEGEDESADDGEADDIIVA